MNSMTKLEAVNLSQSDGKTPKKGTPEYKEHRKAYMSVYGPEYSKRPDVIERRKQRESTPEYKEKKRIRSKKLREKQKNDIELKRKQTEKTIKSRNKHFRKYKKTHWERAGIVFIDDSDLDHWIDRIKGTCDWCGRTAQQEGHNDYLCLDHDHETGKPRFALCSACNMIEGYLNKMSKVQANKAISSISEIFK